MLHGDGSVDIYLYDDDIDVHLWCIADAVPEGGDIYRVAGPTGYVAPPGYGSPYYCEGDRLVCKALSLFAEPGLELLCAYAKVDGTWVHDAPEAKIAWEERLLRKKGVCPRCRSRHGWFNGPHGWFDGFCDNSDKLRIQIDRPGR